MTTKERINTIKAKKAQIEALLEAKEKEVEEEYQMVMELYNEVSERVEAIKTKQKATEETLDKYGLLAFLNDGAETTEETTEESAVVETKEESAVVETTNVKEEPKKSDSDSSVVKQKWNIDTSKKEPTKEEIDKIFAAAGFGEEVKEEVKEPVKQEYVDETLTQEDRDKANPDEIDALLNMI